MIATGRDNIWHTCLNCVIITDIFENRIGHRKYSITYSGAIFPIGYSCAYTDSVSWASPSDPLPMIRDPRTIFDQLFGGGATPEERATRRREDKSIIDSVTASVQRLKAELGAADRARLTTYLEDVREIERRIQRVEQQNASGEPRDLPGAPKGVPDSFEEHVKLMFDLQALAFASDLTRVTSFKLSRDVSGRVVAAISVAGPAERLEPHEFQVAQVTMEVAATVSRRLGHRGNVGVA